MRRTPVLVVLGLLLGITRAAADECAVLPRARMRVRLTVPEPLEPAVSVIRDVVDHTWGPAGLHFVWVDTPVDRDAWQNVDVWVAAVRDRPASGTGGVMGEVLFKDGYPRRLIRLSVDAAQAWVRRDRVARLGLKGHDIGPAWRGGADLLPQALGAIAAHEVGHFVLGSSHHARDGVMRAVFDRPERLVHDTESLSLDAWSRRRLDTRLRQSESCRR